MCFSSWRLRAVGRILRAGGVIAYPTEAVFGLGCEPLSAHAVHRLLALKGRSPHKGLILIAAEREQLDPFVNWNALSAERDEAIQKTWPGPVTWLLPAKPHVPVWLRGEHATIAVRITAHAPVRELCLSYGGALVSTSANISGKPPASSALAVQRLFGQEVDLILHGPLGGLTKPTEIRDGITGRVIRAA